MLEIRGFLTLDANLLVSERLQKQHSEDTEHFRLVEIEKNDVIKENEELKHWKLVYEAGHGLQELARNQKVRFTLCST